MQKYSILPQAESSPQDTINIPISKLDEKIYPEFGNMSLNIVAVKITNKDAQ